MTAHDLAGAYWKKSSRSSGNGQCVEVADNLPGVVGLRDSKDPSGPALTFTSERWSDFLTATKTGRFGDA